MSVQTGKVKHRFLMDGFVVEIDERIDLMLQDNDAMQELQQLWQKAPVMVFRRQSMHESEQVKFSGFFGNCESANRKDIQSPYFEEIIYFSTLRYADGSFIGGFAGGEDVDWHSDQTFKERPATGALLYGVEVPKDGGDIYWANQYAAWEALPDDIKEKIDGRMGVYKYEKRLAILNPLELQDKNSEQVKAMTSLPDAYHPVVLTHPVTGRKALYADPTTLVAIEGLSEAENARILPILFETGGREDFVYRHKCNNGDVIMWDNGCTMHRRDEMRLDQPRLMKRTTFRLPNEAYCSPH